MEMRTNQSIGEIIRYYRRLKNYSQKELAEVLNVTESAVSAWERGLSKPGLDIAIRLVDAIGMDLVDFYFMPQKTQNSISYQLYDTIQLKRSFFELYHLEVDLYKQVLIIEAIVTGMTVDDEYVNDELNLAVKAGSVRLESKGRQVIEKKWIRPKISPELENVPLQSNRYFIRESFALKTLDDAKITIKENGFEAKIGLSKQVLELLDSLKLTTIDSVTVSAETLEDFSKLLLLQAKHQPDYFKENLKRVQFK